MDTYKTMFYSMISTMQYQLNEIKELGKETQDYKNLVVKLVNIEKQLNKIKGE